MFHTSLSLSAPIRGVPDQRFPLRCHHIAPGTPLLVPGQISHLRQLPQIVLKGSAGASCTPHRGRNSIHQIVNRFPFFGESLSVDVALVNLLGEDAILPGFPYVDFVFNFQGCRLLPIYWHFSELRGAGDLRPYILVQYYPMLVIPLIVLLFPPRYTRSSDLLGVVGLYAPGKMLRFLGKSTLFKDLFYAWFLRLLGVIPVARAKDKGSQMSSNLLSRSGHRMHIRTSPSLIQTDSVFPVVTRMFELGHDVPGLVAM